MTSQEINGIINQLGDSETDFQGHTESCTCFRVSHKFTSTLRYMPHQFFEWVSPFKMYFKCISLASSWSRISGTQKMDEGVRNFSLEITKLIVVNLRVVH